MGDEHRYSEIFVPDCGALLDIRVFNVTVGDWQSLLDFLSANYFLAYLEDGIVQELPRFSIIRQTQKEKALTLQILLPGFTVNMHFFVDDEIEMDVLPEDVNSFEKADAVFALIKSVAHLLKKEVLLVEETSICDPEELKRIAVCLCDPSDLEIRYISQSD